MELGSMWNIKPHHDVYALDSAKHQHHAMDTMFSSTHLLTQLLISQAILDSNDFQVLTFDALDKLKKVIQTYIVCMLAPVFIIQSITGTAANTRPPRQHFEKHTA